MSISSMISAEATRQGGRSNFGLVFIKIHAVKSYQIYSRVQASLALSSAPRRIAEKIVVWCSGPLEWFSNRCLLLENSQVESLCRIPIGSHWWAGWVLWVWSSSVLEPRSSCGSKIGYHITLTRISSSFWWENKARVYGRVWACPA